MGGDMKLLNTQVTILSRTTPVDSLVYYLISGFYNGNAFHFIATLFIYDAHITHNLFKIGSLSMIMLES